MIDAIRTPRAEKAEKRWIFTSSKTHFITDWFTQ